MDREVMVRRNREGGEGRCLAAKGEGEVLGGRSLLYGGPTCHREEAVEAWELGLLSPLFSWNGHGFPQEVLGHARAVLGCGDLLGWAYLSKMNVHCESLRELGA